MSLDRKMLKIMKDLKFPCKKHNLPPRGVVVLLRRAHTLAKHGQLKELNQIYRNMECPKLKGYISEVYEEGVKRKAHRLLNKGGIKELDELYRAQDCENLHKYIMGIYQSKKSWEDISCRGF